MENNGLKYKGIAHMFVTFYCAAFCSITIHLLCYYFNSSSVMKYVF